MRAKQLQCVALLIVLLSGRAYSGILVQATRFFSEGGVSLQLDEDGEFALTGHTGTAGLETEGPPLNGAACFIARFSPSGENRYYRYIAGFLNCTKAAFRKSDGSIWLTASPSGPQDGQVTITADLAPDFDYRLISTRYLLRLDANDGSLISVTRFPSDWTGFSLMPQIAVDSAGTVWLGGYASGPFPDTPDAASPITYIPGFTTAGTLMRLSPEGDRILYATHAGGRAVAALAIDSADNIYVVGLSVQKLSNAGRLLWTKTLGMAGLTISVNSNSGVFVGGCTMFLEGFTTTENAFQSKTDDTTTRRERFPPYYPNRPCVDGFVARFSGDGDLIYATLIGGVGKDFVNFISADDEGRATVSGTIENRPKRLKDIYWVPGYSDREFIARLNPGGSEVDYFTNFLLGAYGSSPPIRMSDGSLVFVRTESKKGELANTYDSGLNLYTVRSAPSELPRIDQVEPNVDVAIVGFGKFSYSYALEIRGEGFGDNAEVWLDDTKLPLASSAPGTPLKALRFTAPQPLDTAYFFQELGTASYNLTVRVSDGSVSRPVLITLRYTLMK